MNKGAKEKHEITAFPLYNLSESEVKPFPLSLFFQVLYKHEGQSALKVLDKGKTSVTLPLPKDNGYVVLEIRSWGEGGDGAAHETIVSRDSGTGMMVQNQAGSPWSNHAPLLLTATLSITLIGLLDL